MYLIVLICIGNLKKKKKKKKEISPVVSDKKKKKKKRVIWYTVLADSIYNILIFLLKKCE